jgi:hypothetical protein
MTVLAIGGTIRAIGGTVWLWPPLDAAPVISNVMLSPTPVVVGEEVTVSFDVTGWPVPDVTIEWRRDAEAIPGADEAGYVPVEDDSEGILTAFISATNSVDTDTAESAGSEVFMGPIIEGGGWEDESGEPYVAADYVEAGYADAA